MYNKFLIKGRIKVFTDKVMLALCSSINKVQEIFFESLKYARKRPLYLLQM